VQQVASGGKAAQEEKKAERSSIPPTSTDTITVRSSSPGEKEFRKIKDRSSNIDIRKVYKFIKLIGGGHFG